MRVVMKVKPVLAIARWKLLYKKDAASRFFFLLLTPRSCKNSSPHRYLTMARHWGGSHELRLPAYSGFYKEEEGYNRVSGAAIRQLPIAARTCPSDQPT